MVSIVVEDGSIVTGANSYVSDADLTSYASDRGVTITGNTSQLLIQAMDYIESLTYIGIKRSITQPLQWPRFMVYIDDYYFNSTAIPKELKNAQIAVALAIDAGKGPLQEITQPIKRMKADAVEIEYMDGSSNNTTVRTIRTALWKLLASGNSENSIKVNKG